MIRRLAALGPGSIVVSGSQRKCTVATCDGDYVLKLPEPNAPRRTTFNELFGGSAAPICGVGNPPFALVEVGEVELHDKEGRPVVPGEYFGSALLREHVKLDPADVATLPAEPPYDLLAFDLLLLNVDRKFDDVLRRGADLVAINHGNVLTGADSINAHLDEVRNDLLPVDHRLLWVALQDAERAVAAVQRLRAQLGDQLPTVLECVCGVANVGPAERDAVTALLEYRLGLLDNLAAAQTNVLTGRQHRALGHVVRAHPTPVCRGTCRGTNPRRVSRRDRAKGWVRKSFLAVFQNKT